MDNQATQWENEIREWANVNTRLNLQAATYTGRFFLQPYATDAEGNAFAFIRQPGDTFGVAKFCRDGIEVKRHLNILATVKTLDELYAFVEKQEW